jgi:hypothetical protein
LTATAPRALQPRAQALSLAIAAQIPAPGRNNMPQPAEILLLDPDPNAVVLGVMS